jgi:hypothetical protein
LFSNFYTLTIALSVAGSAIDHGPNLNNPGHSTAACGRQSAISKLYQIWIRSFSGKYMESPGCTLNAE